VSRNRALQIDIYLLTYLLTEWSFSVSSYC